MDKNSPQSLLTKFIRKNDTVIVGVSGGPDSMYLLTQCLQLQKKHPFTIVVAHVNHKLREKESDRDADFVKKFADKNRLACETKNLRAPAKGNLEEWCRNQRYAFFEQLRKKYKAAWILTAHHHDDNIETVLFNLARGSFLGGLKGIKMASAKRYLLRPLLQTTKSEILNFLKKNRIKYCLDRTNQDLHFSRNLLRHKIIPLLQTINPNFTGTFSENLRNFEQAADFMDTFAQEWLDQNFKNDAIPLQLFLDQKPVIQKTILAVLYKKMYESSNKFNQKHLAQIINVLHQKKSNRKKEFGDKYFLNVSKNEEGSRVMRIVRKY